MLYMCTQAMTCMCTRACLQVREQLCGVDSLFPPLYKFQESDSGPEAE